MGKQENFEDNKPQRFSFKLLSFVCGQIQTFDCKKPQTFSTKLFEFLYKWNLTSVAGNLCKKVMGDLTYTPFDWQVPMKSLYPTSLWTKYQVLQFWLIFIDVLRIVFLKFSHVPDDGSEIDLKYDIHPSFVTVIWFKS